MAKIEGSINIVGDKSLSHRAVMLCSLANGISNIRNILISGDTKATINIFKQLGVEIKEINVNEVEIHGVGLHGLKQPKEALDAINSGTTARLLTGLLSKQKFKSELTGSKQLIKRPMDRVVKPLLENGAVIKDSDGRLPIYFEPSDYEFENINSTKPSAQVKSSFLLASLYHKNFPTTITEETPTRDHTERMLNLMGVNTVRLGNSVTIEPTKNLSSLDYTIPGDPSSASFLIALGLMKSNKLVIEDILLNERRIGFLKILKKMNADISIENLEMRNNESVGDIHVKKSKLTSIQISKEDVSDMVDEFPIFTLLASQASGVTTVSGAEELRLKESDRIKSMEKFISTLGGSIEVKEDGFMIPGEQKLNPGIVETFDDHRIAMTGVIANIAINPGITSDNIECISDSYPSFFEDLHKIGASYDY